MPGSGYRGGHGPFPNPTVRLIPACRHPALEGLEDGFRDHRRDLSEDGRLRIARCAAAARSIRLRRQQLHSAAARAAAGTSGVGPSTRQQSDRLGERRGHEPRRRFRRRRRTAGVSRIPAFGGCCTTHCDGLHRPMRAPGRDRVRPEPRSGKNRTDIRHRRRTGAVRSPSRASLRDARVFQKLLDRVHERFRALFLG